MLWGLATLAMLLSLTLLALARRGRRVGDAPHCRRCNFDLSGLSDAERCPECGRSLGTPRAIRTGERRRRPVALAGSLLCLLLAVALGTLGISGSQTAWNAYKPTRLLVWEATRLTGDARDAAGAELLTRHKAKPLANDQLAALTDPAIDVQADLSINWEQSPWWRLLDAAFTAGVVNDRQLARYVRAAHQTLTVRLPDAMFAEESWPSITTRYQLDHTGPMRLVPSQAAAFVSSLVAAELDGNPLPLSRSGYDTSEGWRWTGEWRGISVTPAAFGFAGNSYMTSYPPAEAEPHRVGQWRTMPGPHTLRLIYAIEGYPLLQPPPGQSGSRPEPVASWTVTIEHPFEAFRSPAMMCHRVTSNDRPNFDPTCTVSSNVNGVQVRPYTRRGADPGSVTVMLSISRADHIPDGPWIVGRVELRHEGRALATHAPYRRETEPATIALGPPGRGSQGFGVDLVLPDVPRLDTVDVVIVPDLAEAARRGCSGELWNEEIVIEGVALDWSKMPQPGSDPGSPAGPAPGDD